MPLPTSCKLTCLFICLALTLAPDCPAGTGSSLYPVVRVVDGDTIAVVFGGRTEKIRMLNVDTPESVHPNPARNTRLGKHASDYTRRRLSGRHVGLEFDGKKRGKYGRLLAYVILDEENFNLELVRQGWSPYYTKYGPSRTYHDAFEAAQASARRAGLNIWRRESSGIVSARAFRGNIKSKKFHAMTCRHAGCKHCTRAFFDRAAAVKAGFSPCGLCRP